MCAQLPLSIVKPDPRRGLPRRRCVVPNRRGLRFVEVEPALVLDCERLVRRVDKFLQLASSLIRHRIVTTFLGAPVLRG